MKAVQFHEFGPPAEVLRCEDIPAPVPRSGEVLVRMLASPVNPSDLMSVSGGYSITPTLPAVPGFEGVGIVEKSGGGFLARYMKGRRVAVLNRERGNWAEKTVVTARQVIPLAARLPIEQAAMFFINPATAYILTRMILNVPPGAWLLQTAANSSLGRMVIRLGRLFDFKTINVVRREAEIERLKYLGANEVIAYDVERDDPEEFLNRVQTITGGVQYAIDPVGGKLASAVALTLTDDAQMILFGSLSNEEVAIFPRTLMTPNATIRGFWLGGWMMKRTLFQKLSLVKKITKLILDGTLSSDVSEEFPLERIHDAVIASQQSGRSGKVLLRIADA